MAYQLIYTSIRSGLIAGRSGFCTVARHREIKESLVARLEDFASSYDRGVLNREGALPILYSCRVVDIRDSRYHVLMRLSDAGNDYSGRTNHLAHFFVLEPGELTGLRITPAEAILALQQRGFWKDRYEGSAAYLGDGDIVPLASLAPAVNLPASTWSEWSGDPGNAAYLFGSEGPQKTGFPTQGDTEEAAGKILRLFAEGALLNSPERTDARALWSVPFTTLLQSNSERRTFPWAGIPAGTSLAENEAATGRRLFTPGEKVPPPGGNLAAVAAGREVAPVHSQVLLPPEERTATELESPQPDQAGAAFETERVSLPGATTPALYTEAVPELPVPISLTPRAKEKRREGKGLLKIGLIAGAVFCLLCIVGATVFHFTMKERKDLEKEIGDLIAQSRWSEIKEILGKDAENPDLIKDTKTLRDWRELAVAIVFLNEIKSSPHKFGGRDEEGGDSAVIRHINGIVAAVPESETWTAEEYANGARTAVNVWENSKEQLEKARSAIRAAANTQPLSFPFENRDDFNKAKEGLEQHYKDHPSKNDPSKNDLIIVEMTNFETVEDYFNKLKDYEAKSPADTSKEKPADLEALKNFIDKKSVDTESRTSLVAIQGRFESLYDSRRPKDTQEPKVTLKEIPKPEKAETTVIKEEATPAETWPIYLVPLTKDNELDLSVIEGLGALPDEFRFEPVASEPKVLSKRTKVNYYIGGSKPVLSAKEMTLEVEKESKYSKLFANGAKLLPTSEKPAYEIIVMAGETTSDSPPLLDELPISDCITRREGTAFQIAERAMQQLERFISRPDGKWKMKLSLENESWTENGELGNLSVNPEEKVNGGILQRKKAKSSIEKSEAIGHDLKNTFRRLDEIVFPDFEQSHIDNFEIEDSKGNFKIVQKKNPRTFKDGRRPENFQTKSKYYQYINELLDKKLDQFANDSENYKKAAGKIETASTVGGEIDHKKIVQQWVKLAEQSKEKEWAKNPQVPSASKKREEAEDKLKTYSADLYFSRFFRGWEEVFLDKEKTEHLVRYLTHGNPRPNTYSSDEIDQKVQQLKTQLKQLKSDDILKHLQVSFYYTWAEKRDSGPPIPKSFLVLQSKPDAAN